MDFEHGSIWLVAPTQEEGWFTTDDGARLWYAVEGEGEPLVLCHGGPGLWDNLGRLATPLAAHALVVRWEQRGSGRSEMVGPYTIDRFVADLDQLRRHLGVERWVVGGHSWGATLALHAALASPMTTRGLLYVSGVGIGRAWHVAYRAEADRRRTSAELNRLHELKARSRTPDEEVEFRTLSWMPDFADQAEALALATVEARSSFPINREANTTLNAETGTWEESDLVGRCHRLMVPALILHGDHDPRPSWALSSLVDALPRCQLAVMPDVGHLPWVEAPQATTQLIDEFLASIP